MLVQDPHGCVRDGCLWAVARAEFLQILQQIARRSFDENLGGALSDFNFMLKLDIQMRCSNMMFKLDVQT